MLPNSVALLLDYAPRTWCSRDDFNARLCQTLNAQDRPTVLVHSRDVPQPVASRLRSSGAFLETIDYGKGIRHYSSELGRLIRRHHVDLVHICFFDYFSPVAWLARLHGVQRIIFSDVNGGISRATSWRRFLLRCRAKMMTLPVLRLMALSEFVKGRLVGLGIDPNRIRVVYGGIDLERFSPDPLARDRLAREYGIAPGELILATVSALVPIKRPEVALDACGLLAQRGVRARLFVAGDGPMRTELEERCRALGIADRVHWLGHHDAPERLLQAADIFVLTTHGEAFGLALAEAQACAVPVVGSRSGGIPEVVEDGKSGLLATPLDPSSFADALERLGQDPTLRREMGQHGRTRVLQMFNVDFAVERTLDVYRSLSSS